MKTYMKNKDFIPEKFYKKVELNTNKKENKILMLFLIINLLFVGQTAKYISEIKETPIISRNNYMEQNKVNFDDINLWIKSIMTDDIEEAYITNNSGEILVSDLNKIDKITSNNLIKVDDINLNSSEKYKLGVSLYE